MAFRSRRRSTRRRPTRKYGRKYYKRRGTTGIRIKRTVALAANISGGVASDNVIWNQSSRATGFYNFSLSDLPNNGEITALYSLYKLTGVSLRFIPLAGTDATAGATTLMDSFAYNIDKSIRGVPLNMDEILEAGGARVVSAAARPFKIWIPYPKTATTLSGTTAGMVNPWIDSDANGIKHFGLRYAFQQSLATATVRFQVYATYYLRVRTLK